MKTWRLDWISHRFAKMQKCRSAKFPKNFLCPSGIGNLQSKLVYSAQRNKLSMDRGVGKSLRVGTHQDRCFRCTSDAVGSPSPSAHKRMHQLGFFSSVDFELGEWGKVPSPGACILRMERKIAFQFGLPKFVGARRPVMASWSALASLIMMFVASSDLIFAVRYCAKTLGTGKNHFHD